jgi:Ca2+-transporting ATPase
VDESALTGESMPARKHHEVIAEPQTPLGDRDNMVYMGTLVTGDSGRAVVVATADVTEIGTIQALVGTDQAPETPMQRQLGDMGTQLALLSGGICAAVFGVGVLRGYGWLEMLKASTSLAVAAVPEGLPAVATTTLALGIRHMRSHKVLVRQLDAVETLGAVQVFCLDKTGTLTLNRMSVVALHAGLRHAKVVESRLLTPDDGAADTAGEEWRRLFEVVTLCNESQITGEGEALSIDGSATENALLEAAMLGGVDVAALRRRLPLHEVEYRAEGRHYMRTWHDLPDGGRLLAVKGSPDQVLELCRWHIKDGERLPLGEEDRRAIYAANQRMAGDALRVLGVAYAEGTDLAQDAGELTWLGLAGMADPIRPGMGALMERFHGAGVDTAMITGDQSSTAYAIGRELGLSHDHDLEILESAALAEMDTDVLRGLSQKVDVFARVSPADKLNIVQALQKAGRVVAMTGDGINDGPALKAADIGVAMGSSGTDVARSVADVVLEDDNLHTMVTAVRQGRTIYGNIRKTLHFLLATNLSEIEVMLAAVALGAGQPLTPMQLLWINLMSDIFPGLALAMEPPEADVMARPPRDPEEPVLRREDLIRTGVESGVITGGAMASYLYALARYGVGPQASSQAFMTLTTGQLLHALVCRSDETSLFDPRGRPRNPYLTVALGASLGVQLLAALVPGLRKLLGITVPSVVDAAVMAAGALGPLAINEAAKRLRSGSTVPSQPTSPETAEGER